MHAVVDAILGLPPLAAYVVIGLLVFGEAAVFLGFVLPGETAVVLGGVLAWRGDVHLSVLVAVVVVAAVIGDSVGYEVGLRYGERVLEWPLVRDRRPQIDRARLFLRTRGGTAVFLGRWTAFLRAVMPGLAGVSRMPYRRFLAWNAVGGVVWGVTFCLVGFLAGNSYHAVERVVGRVGAAATAVVVVVLLVIWHLRRRRAEGTPSGDSPAGEAGGQDVRVDDV